MKYENQGGRPAMEMLGKIFGRLTVLSRAPSGTRGGKPRWTCQCSCGVVVDVPGHRLRSGDNKSCGCFRRDRAGALYLIHGKSKTPQYTMFYDARKRAVALGLPFDITPDDVVVPVVCPVLGLILGSGGREQSPSLDRVIPSKGYVKGNINVISFRANRVKSDATEQELTAVLAYVTGAKNALR